MLESRRLRHFLTIYELGSIGQAADRLLLTQPALSKSIRQLEEGLGAKLFDRTTAGVEPTVFGRALASHAKAIETQVRQAEAAIAALQGKAKGRVRVGVGPSVAGGIMPAATEALLCDNPDIKLEVTEGLVDTLVPLLRRGDLDMAVGSWPRVIDPALTVEPLMTGAIEVFARAGHPLAGRRATLTELLGQPWALPPATQRWRQSLDELFYAAGLPPPRPKVESNSAAYLVALLTRTDCLTFLPAQVAAGHRELAPVLLEGNVAFEPEVTITYKARAMGASAVAEVAQALRSAASASAR